MAQHDLNARAFLKHDCAGTMGVPGSARKGNMPTLAIGPKVGNMSVPRTG